MQAQRPYVTTFKVLRLGFKPTSWIQNPVFIPEDMLLPLEQGKCDKFWGRSYWKVEEMTALLGVKDHGRGVSWRPGRLMLEIGE